MTDWKKRFMETAEHFAQWSKDPSTKVGAIIVDCERRLVGAGYNGFPRGVSDDAERYEHKPTKYELIVHAESNALMNAVKSVSGCAMYSTKFPCNECAKQIVQMGISKIVAPHPTPDWAEKSSFALQMFREAYIILDFV